MAARDNECFIGPGRNYGSMLLSNEVGSIFYLHRRLQNVCRNPAAGCIALSLHVQYSTFSTGIQQLTRLYNIMCVSVHVEQTYANTLRATYKVQQQHLQVYLMTRMPHSSPFIYSAQRHGIQSSTPLQHKI